MINENKNNQPLDLSYLRDMSGDSADFMIEMLDTFLEQTPKYIADLEAAINTGNWKLTAECAHKMKPTFAYIGRDDVKDFMQVVERNARELTNVEELPAALAEIKSFSTILYKQLDQSKAELQKQL